MEYSFFQEKINRPFKPNFTDQKVKVNVNVRVDANRLYIKNRKTIASELLLVFFKTHFISMSCFSDGGTHILHYHFAYMALH